MPEDLLFSQLRELYIAKNLPDCEKKFVKDGIIDPTLFAEQPIKILFIAKEHNYLGGYGEETDQADYRVWWNCHVHLQFSHRISEWAYGILNNFPSGYDQLSYDQKHQALRSVAFINVKKASGNASANPEIICQYINESRELLLQQIKEIAPDLIIGCFRHDYYIELLFGNKLTRATSNAYSYGRSNDGIKIINFYHPSSRKNKLFLYTNLGEAVGANQ